MPSVIPGFEYDIFISYRQKDNGSGWVTDFVDGLNRELRTTFKEDITVYFDINPHNGLLETHNVDKSLEGKLKCLILIPILSQTYCDPNSYAWQQEFCVFNMLASSDRFGRDIKLRNGNVTSRVLPVCIHNLDFEDRNLIETELKAKVRSVDFIFRSPGVNRPLRPDDKREDNSNKLFYRDQLNKVANAIKEIIGGIKYPERSSDISYPTESEEPDQNNYLQNENKILKPAVQDNSIAVLPFVSLAQDASQDYFADGITENILIQLAGLRNLRVISRTSVMRYKKTAKSAPEIAAELRVKYILEGSVQSQGNKVRIHVQLIDSQQDTNIWGKVFVESLDDIFSIQSNVAEIVARELNASLYPEEDKRLKEIPTKDKEAYDLFLKGRHAFNQWNLEGYRTAERYFKQALEKDADFALAYSYLASTYSALMSWNGDLSPEESLNKIKLYLPEAWKRGATDNDYLTKAFVEFFINKDFSYAENLLLKAMEIGPNNASVLYTYSYVLNMAGRSEEALAIIEKAKAIDPINVSLYNYQGISFYLMKRYDEALTTFQEALQLYPQVLRQYDHLARVYLTMGRFQESVDTLEFGLRSSKIRPPSMIAYLAAAYTGLQQKEKADGLLEELLQRSHKKEKGVNLYIAHVYNALGDRGATLTWLDQAVITNDIDLIWRNVDPLLKNLKEHLPIQDVSPNGKDSMPNYREAEKFIIQKMEQELPANLQYHNLHHTQDVLQSAIKIAESEKISKEDIHLLRLAALFHDSGFINSPKNHEEYGCELAKKILPSFGLQEKQLQIICGMILATRTPQLPTTPLEKILCDADLDYLGRNDFYELGNRLYEEMKTRGYVETEREWNLIQRSFLESHRYHTTYALTNRESSKRQFLQEIITKLQKPRS